MAIDLQIERDRREGHASFKLLSNVAPVVICVAIATALVGFAGCDDHDLPPDITKQAVKFDDVPDNVRSAARKAIPGVNLNEAWKNLGKGGKLHSYEIRGKNAADGKTREVRVSETGDILEME
jgi:hypothetical protein